MSDVGIAAIFTIGSSAWIYSKILRSTGGNTKSALTAAAGCALLLFLATLTLIKTVF